MVMADAARQFNLLVLAAALAFMFYNAPMLDMKEIRERTDYVRERLGLRGGGEETKVDEVLALDHQRRKLLAELEALRAERNRISKEIGALMGQKRAAEAEAKKEEVRAMGSRMDDLERSVLGVESARETMLLTLPNLPHTSVTVGKTAADNPLIRSWGEKSAFAFKARTHIELCDELR